MLSELSKKMKIPTVILLYLFVHTNGERIAGGNTTVIGDYPFAAALLTNNGDGVFSHACGGTILTNRALLSAASCFYTNEIAHPVSWWRARVGSNFSNAGGTIYLINGITTHPDFSPTTLNNDIALLRTTLTIVLIPNLVQAAPIAGSAYTFTTNQPVLAIGWGAVSAAEPSSSEQLRHVEIWAVDQQMCANRYSPLGITVTSTMICAGWLDVGVRGQCEGDVGSPLVDNGAVVGVFSRSEGCAHLLYPGINTQVAPFSRWIVATAVTF